MKKRIKILTGVLIGLFILNLAIIINDIHQELKIREQVATKMLETDKLTIAIIHGIVNTVDDLKREDMIIYNRLESDYSYLLERINNLPKDIQVAKEKLEQNLKQVNVEILNTTIMASGSGVTIKYKGEYYILSAGHMADEDTDILVLMENGQEIGELEIVKHDYTWKNDVDDVSSVHDLILLRPKNKLLQPKYYTELADNEPITATQVYIVGNPMSIEDVVSDGRIIKYKGNFMYISDSIYYGSSGGGVYNYEGKLVGIVSYLMPIQPYSDIPAWTIYGIVRLNVVKSFLEDIK